jgi:hypothetical protein
MARSPRPNAPTVVAYSGEVWTDARGLATVNLPEYAEAPQPPIEYAVRNLEGRAATRVAAELEDGRFTIETDQPHVKVAWRITGQRPRPPLKER